MILTRVFIVQIHSSILVNLLKSGMDKREVRETPKFLYR
jgi:hypothetical protein